MKIIYSEKTDLTREEFFLLEQASDLLREIALQARTDGDLERTAELAQSYLDEFISQYVVE